MGGITRTRHPPAPQSQGIAGDPTTAGRPEAAARRCAVSGLRRIGHPPAMPAPEIRRMEAHEIPDAVAVWARSRWDAQPWLEARMQHSHADDLRHFREVVARSCDVWLAFEEGRLAGLLAIAGGRLEQLYVDPSHQGRGIGTALLQKARQLSPRGLTLFTHQRNERARAFYERRGFRPVAFGISPAPECEPDVEYAWEP